MIIKRTLSLLLLVLFAAVVQADDSEGAAFPKALADEIYDRAFLKREYYRYNRFLTEEVEAPKEAKLAWKPGEVFNETAFNEVTLSFESDRLHKTGRGTFEVVLQFQEDGKVVVRHSHPAGREYANGLRAKFQEGPGSDYGGYIYGNEVPGILFFIGRSAYDTIPPMLICPRYGYKDGKKYVIRDLDAKPKLLGVTAKMSGGALAHFLSGYGAGSVQIGFSSQNTSRSVEQYKFVVDRNPKERLDFHPFGDPARFDAEGKPLLAQLTTEFRLQNYAGFTKRVLSSQILWAEERELPAGAVLTGALFGKSVAIPVKGGMCVQLFQVVQERTWLGLPKRDAEEK